MLMEITSVIISSYDISYIKLVEIIRLFIMFLTFEDYTGKEETHYFRTDIALQKCL
jgi:hypothetical protein